MTEAWYDHSASDNLFVRKMHYAEKKMAGYSFWPQAGWDGIFQMLGDVITSNQGEVRVNTPAHQVVIRKGQVEGVLISENQPDMPGELPAQQFVRTDTVICTLPVWNVLDVVPEEDLPDWYASNIKYLAQDKFKICWLGYYIASRDPIFSKDEKELCTWLSAPNSGLGGFAFLNSALDPGVAPDGYHLWVCGATFEGNRGKKWVATKIREFDEDLKIMFPDMDKKGILWNEKRISIYQAAAAHPYAADRHDVFQQVQPLHTEAEEHGHP